MQRDHLAFSDCSALRSLRGRAILSLLLLLIISAAIAMPARAEEEPRLSVEDAVNLAQERNETLLMALEDQKRAGAQVKEAYSGVLPNLELSASYQYNFKNPAFFAPEEFGGGKVEIGSDFDVIGQIRLDQPS